MLLLFSSQKDIATTLKTTHAIPTDERLLSPCPPYTASPVVFKISSRLACDDRCVYPDPCKVYEHRGLEEIWTFLKND
jgi:hypothetical protein